MKQQKGISTPFAILVVGIVAIIGFTIVFSYQYIWVPEEEEARLLGIETPKDETADWKMYGNEEYGFEMKYPSDKRTVSEINKMEEFYKYDPKYYTMFHVANIYSPDNSYTRLSIYVDRDSGTPKKCLTRQYSGKPFTKTENINGIIFNTSDPWSDPAMGGSRSVRKRYGVVYNDYCYVIETTVFWKDISFVKGVTGGGVPTSEELKEQENWIEEQKEINNKILSTFKFIE